MYFIKYLQQLQMFTDKHKLYILDFSSEFNIF